jgi:hypothetical protein
VQIAQYEEEEILILPVELEQGKHDVQEGVAQPSAPLAYLYYLFVENNLLLTILRAPAL